MSPRCVLALLFLLPGVSHATPPKDFAIIFNLGYSRDSMPKDNAEFEKLVVSLKSAHFNVLLAQHTEQRLALCKKHGMKLFVDLLVPDHHVFRNTEGARKLCESLKNNDTIYGYHLWSDNIATTAEGRTRDVNNVRKWDDTHPIYVGCANMSRINRVEGMDVFGYYDFHWKRGKHWANLQRARDVAKGKKIPFLRYDDAVSGLVGKGNANRVGYTWATSIPFGLKGYTYHYAGGIIDTKTGKLDAIGDDLAKVNEPFAAVGPELMKIGLPIGVYSTTITKTAKNDPLKEATLPSGLQTVPKEHWFQVSKGEVLLGEFVDGEKRDVLVFATHNPYEKQSVSLTLPKGTKNAEAFDRKTGKWQPLKIAADAITFEVREAAVDLVRITR